MKSPSPSFPNVFATAFRRIVRVLRARRHPFVVSGALAQNVWGIPRTSADIDILMVCPAIRIPSLLEQLRREAEGEVDLEAALESLRSEYVLRLRCGGVPCELFVPYLPYHSSVLARAVRCPVLGEPDAPVATPEDVIVLKVLFDRDQDWADIEGILIRQTAAEGGSTLELQYVREWVAQMVPQSNARIGRLEKLVREAAQCPGWHVFEQDCSEGSASTDTV